MTPSSDSTSQKPTPPSGSPEQDDSRAAENLHLTTFAHDGRFWDVYLEFAEDSGRQPASCRARLCYVPTDPTADVKPVRTAMIIIEPSYDEAIERARALDRYNLAALLRSAS